jgi:CRP/FNR family cyclic AMP-dependent transcriptional regulator
MADPDRALPGLLRAVSIFADLDEAAAAGLARLVRRRSYAAGEVIASEAERGDALYVLARGKVKVGLYGESGREVILSIFKKPGEFFGEMSLLDDEPRSATVTAMAPSALLVLSRGDFRAHLARHPWVAVQVMTELSRRLRRADAVIGDLALLDVLGRLAARLRDLALAEGEPVAEGRVVRQRPSQAEIAATIGASRETVSRALSELARRGDVQLSGKRLLVRHRLLRRA